MNNYFKIMGLCLGIISTADAMRCNNKIIEEGDDQYKILSACGEPRDKKTYEEPVPIYNAAGYLVETRVQVTERWIYQKSPADFQYQLIFDSGILKKINVNRNPY